MANRRGKTLITTMKSPWLWIGTSYKYDTCTHTHTRARAFSIPCVPIGASESVCVRAVESMKIQQATYVYVSERRWCWFYMRLCLVHMCAWSRVCMCECISACLFHSYHVMKKNAALFQSVVFLFFAQHSFVFAVHSFGQYDEKGNKKGRV